MSSSKPDFRAAWDGLIGVAFEALHGNAQHASRVASDFMARNVEVDIAQELAEFWTRVGGDTARAVQAAQEFVDQMASAQPQTPPQPPTTAGPAAAIGSATAVCSDRQTLGPFSAADVVQPQALRRRGDSSPSVTSDKVTVSPSSVTRNATELQITVDCGGVPRGIYTGALRVGSDEYPFNIYLDPT
ncbi:MAG TPA: hypothetical protein VJ930_12410 [Acidimicrobiia bacterium]|nr:hypothetical protein [Acidimicrobiia bacterium]